MPNWSDENGRYWWVPPGKTWFDAVEIPHPEVGVYPKCKCAKCLHDKGKKKREKLVGVLDKHPGV